MAADAAEHREICLDQAELVAFSRISEADVQESFSCTLLEFCVCVNKCLKFQVSSFPICPYA